MRASNIGEGVSRLIDSGLVVARRDAARAEGAQGIPTQSHTSPSILVYEDKWRRILLYEDNTSIRRWMEAPGTAARGDAATRILVKVRCRANLAHARQSRSDSGLGFQGKVLKKNEDVPSALQSTCIGKGCCSCSLESVIRFSRPSPTWKGARK